jgi:hypothetical protein
MPMPQIATRLARSGIVRLADVLKKGKPRFVVYNRTSSYSSAGKGKAKLEERGRRLYWEINRLGVDVSQLAGIIFNGIELGTVAAPRPVLIKAAKYAKERNLILVAADLSQFIRAEKYDRRRYRNAFPTDGEFDRLREITFGVRLATVADPAMTETARIQLKIDKSPNSGRPSAIPERYLSWILEQLHERTYWGGTTALSMQKLADKIGVSKQAIQRFWDLWKGFYNPRRAYIQAKKCGLLTPDGRRLTEEGQKIVEERQRTEG